MTRSSRMYGKTTFATQHRKKLLLFVKPLKLK